MSARSAKLAFEGSQIIEVKGYGHCSIAIPSMCLAKHVRELLYNGTLPSSYTQCGFGGPYFIKPGNNNRVRRRPGSTLTTWKSSVYTLLR